MAMGIKGTEAAKEAAEMVLLDDNFASIVNAVHEGRTVHDNIRKVVAWTLPTNGGEALTVVAACCSAYAADERGADPLGEPRGRSGARPCARLRAGGARRDAPAAAAARRAASLALLGMAGVPGVDRLRRRVARRVLRRPRGGTVDVATARTLVVNRSSSCRCSISSACATCTCRRSRCAVRSARAVLWALASIVTAQLGFTYLPS